MSNQASTKQAREIIEANGIFFGFTDAPPAFAIADNGSDLPGDAREIKQHCLSTLLRGARYLCVWDQQQRSDLSLVLKHHGVHRIGTSHKEKAALTRLEKELKRLVPGAARDDLQSQIERKKPGKIIVVSSLFYAHPLGAGHRDGEQRGIDQALVMAMLPPPKGKGPLKIAQSLSALVAKMAQHRYS